MKIEIAPVEPFIPLYRLLRPNGTTIDAIRPKSIKKPRNLREIYARSSRSNGRE